MRSRPGSRTVWGVLLSVWAIAGSAALRSQPQPSIAALPSAWVLPPPAQPPAATVVAVRAGRLFDAKSGGAVDLRNAINNGLVQGPRMQVAGPGIVNTNKGNIRIRC